MEDILKRLCAYRMEYKDHEGYTHDSITLLPAVQLAYNNSQHSTTGKSPLLVEKQWNPLLPVDHLKKNLLTIHPTAKYFHYMWKKACDTAAKCIAEAKEYDKQRWDKSHMKPYFKEEDQGQRRIGSPQEEESHSTKNNGSGDSCDPVKKKPKARKIRLNGKDQRQYLGIFKNQKADKDKWLAEVAIPDRNLHLKRFRASRMTDQSHQ
ncbi:hypothetical protein O181_113260 [Austropuccinia psidii MF-1]|uniref:Uncharacterized protein n=1 Tax=Austropuccinia psidii MF-1 TaxID=1389203 RepID=A0A9Q3PUC0_9BASI|nr:hypothetical protein [Austropuccinia psidii MF-1]